LDSIKKDAINYSNNPKIRHNYLQEPPSWSRDKQEPFPVDVVILWVDGSDPDFVKLKNKYLSLEHSDVLKDPGNSTGINRWRSFGELLQAIQSIKVFARWVRNIFVVTGFGQRPDWYKKYHTDVIYIDHTEIFGDKSLLPTFQCRPIEAHMWNIPNLSEHFIYFNDDMFLGDFLRRDQMFTDDGKIIVYSDSYLPRGHVTSKTPTWKAARQNSANIFAEIFGEKERPWSHHHPVPFTKTLFNEVWNHPKLGLEMKRTSSSRFRKHTDICVTEMISLYALETNRVIQRKIPAFRIEIKGFDSLAELVKKLSRNTYTFYCLNDDVKSPSDNFLLTYKYILETRLPHHLTYDSPEGPSYKFIDEKGNDIADTHEKIEKDIAREFITPDSSVLELGARYGTVSVIVNEKLDNPDRHVVVEPDNTVWKSLKTNRNLYNCQFSILKGVLAKTPRFLKRVDYGYGNFTTNENGEEVKIFDFDTTQRDFGIIFDTLIVDCEGCMEQVLIDFPNILDNMKFITFEQDKPQNCNYIWIKTELRRRGFRQKHASFHQIWIKNKVPDLTINKPYLYTANLTYEGNNNVIPDIIHTMWISKDDPYGDTPIPDKYSRHTRSWLEKHPNSTHLHWTGKEVYDLISSHFPQYLDFYENLEPVIKKCDFARFAVIAVYGGLYRDLDFYCLKNVSPLLRTKNYFIFEPEEHNQVNRNFGLIEYTGLLFNGFFAACKNDIFVLGWMENMAEEKNARCVMGHTGPAGFSTYYYNNPNKDVFIGNYCDILPIVYGKNGNVSKACISSAKNAYTLNFWHEGSGWGDKSPKITKTILSKILSILGH
jgi:FkbM family methyltransferase